MNAEATLRQLDGMFTTSIRTVEPTTENRNRKPSGTADQRVNDDED